MPLANIPKTHNVFTTYNTHCIQIVSSKIVQPEASMSWNISCKVQTLTFRLLQKGRVMQRLRQWCKPSSSIIGNLPFFAQIWGDIRLREQTAHLSQRLCLSKPPLSTSQKTARLPKYHYNINISPQSYSAGNEGTECCQTGTHILGSASTQMTWNAWSVCQ